MRNSPNRVLHPPPAKTKHSNKMAVDPPSDPKKASHASQHPLVVEEMLLRLVLDVGPNHLARG